MLARLGIRFGVVVGMVLLLTGCSCLFQKKDSVTVACQDVNKILSSGDITLDSSFNSWLADFKVRGEKKGSNLNGIQTTILSLNTAACRQLVTGAMSGSEYNKFLFALTTLLPGAGPEGQALAKKIAEAGNLPVGDVMEAGKKSGAVSIGYETALKILLSVNTPLGVVLQQPDNTPLLIAEIGDLRSSVSKLEGDISSLRETFIKPQTSHPLTPAAERRLQHKVEVEFALGKSDISDEMTKRLKEELMPFEKKQGRFSVFGYADRSGSSATNELLSRNRAYVVARWITENLDVPWTNIEISGFGSV